MLTGALRSMIVPDVHSDPRFSTMAVTQGLGIGAYTGVPVRHADGRLYGTLCILHPSEREAVNGEVALLALAARILMHVIDAHELARSEERLAAVMTHAPLIVFSVDRNGVFTLGAGYGLAHLGLSPNELTGQSVFDVYSGVPQVIDNMRRALRGEAFHSTVHVGDCYFDCQYTPRIDAAGAVTGVVGVATDVTEAKRAEGAVRASDERYRALVETSPDAIGAITPDGVVVMANQAAASLLGFERVEELIGASISTLIAPEDLARAFDVLGQRVAGMVSATRNVGYTLIRRDGTRLAAEVSTSDLRGLDRGIEGFLLVIHDVTERKAFEETLKHQALHDPLTGLPNRSLLRDRLQQAILGAEGEKTDLGLLFTDLDSFKEINDTFGHHVGDALLQELANRLRSGVRDIDTVARLGGDEFAILLPGIGAAGALRIAKRLRSATSRPCDVAGHRVDVDLSIGVAMYPDHGRDPSVLMRRADMAMYASKRSGSGCGYTMFRGDQEVHQPSRLSHIRALREAIENDRLVLHYQPQADLRTGVVVGVEALVRWPRGEQGFVPPADFIPLAEETGLIGALTLSVLRQALRQSRLWHDSGVAVRIAVNLSASTLHDAGILKALTRLIHAAGTPPSCLEIEITESALLVDPAGAREFLGRLHGMGVRIAIDDFGMGHSSLTLVRQLPIDSIKIDKSFILQVTDNQDDAFIAESIVNLGHHLGLGVTAEGIETVEAWDHLAGLGCDVAQGYFLAPPMPAQDFPEWLARREERETASRLS